MQLSIRDADPDAPEALACLRAYFDFLLDVSMDLTPEMLPLPLPDAGNYRPPKGAFLLACADGSAFGCVSLHPLAGSTAEIKRLWVAPEVRGTGLARRLMQAIESRACQMGFTTLKLDSNSRLTTAIALYRAMGWQDCAPYTGFPADIWMSKRL
jgi:GNAT superfamily N-acetyltransferase